MSIQEYKNDIDKLLVEIAFAGASHGLVDEINVMGVYLSKMERTSAPAILATALAHIVRAQYDDALVILDHIIYNAQASKYHEEANQLKALVLKISGKKEAFEAQLAHVSSQFRITLG